LAWLLTALFGPDHPPLGLALGRGAAFQGGFACFLRPSRCDSRALRCHEQFLLQAVEFKQPHPQAIADGRSISPSDTALIKAAV